MRTGEQESGGEGVVGGAVQSGLFHWPSLLRTGE